MNNADKITRDIERSLKTLNKLSPALVADLVRRSRYRATEKPRSVQGAKSKGTHSDPTLAAVVRKLSGEQGTDPIFEAVRTIAQTLNDMAQLAMQIDESIRFVTDVAERAKESTIIHCLACNREVAGTPKDRVRSGMCQADYQRWIRAGRPYRQQFFLMVQQELANNTQNP